MNNRVEEDTEDVDKRFVHVSDLQLILREGKCDLILLVAQNNRTGPGDESCPAIV